MYNNKGVLSQPTDAGMYSCHLHHHYCGLHERREFQVNVEAPVIQTTHAPKALPAEDKGIYTHRQTHTSVISVTVPLRPLLVLTLFNIAVLSLYGPRLPERWVDEDEGEWWGEQRWKLPSFISISAVFCLFFLHCQPVSCQIPETTDSHTLPQTSPSSFFHLPFNPNFFPASVHFSLFLFLLLLM